MAEERNLVEARATEPSPADPDATKEELQRRMEEARESITQTVSEIKETVVSQYQQVRESISDSLDWREQYRRHTLPITIGAVGVGAVLGYSVGGVLFGRDDYAASEYDFEEEAERPSAQTPVLPFAVSPSRHSASASVAPASYAGSPESSSGGGPDVGPETRPAYASSSQPQSLAAVEPEEPEKPGLLARFKETKAYDRLTDEVSTLGDRLVDELSRTAQTVVLPMLLSKVKELIGVDLNAQRGAGRGQQQQQSAQPQPSQPQPSATGAGTTGTAAGAAGGGTAGR